MEVNTVEVTPHDLCTGCFACMNICPVNAVQADADSEGFLCPSVDKDKCVNCGKCVRVCPILNKKELCSISEPECYAAWSRDESIRFQSTSGGVFTHLAEAVIEDGGTVVGARYRNDHLVEHALIRTKEDIEQLRQSKYVQSEIGLVFREVKKNLENGRPLLFAGTPCQCAGLKAFLGRDYDNLFLCDFICLGVNSPKVYTVYLQELESQYDSKVKRVWFKNKTYSWKNFSTKIVFENGREYIANRDTDPFMLGYVRPQLTMYMRKSCYQCQFKGNLRPTDITLADFWGVEKAFPDIDIKHGVSAVMIHSEKGTRLFDKIENSVCCLQSTLEQILKSNPRMMYSVEMPAKSQMFWNYFLEDNKFFESIEKIK